MDLDLLQALTRGPKDNRAARVLFNDPEGNAARKNSAIHVYDDLANPKAAKQRGGKPTKQRVQSEQ